MSFGKTGDSAWLDCQFKLAFSLLPEENTLVPLATGRLEERLLPTVSCALRVEIHFSSLARPLGSPAIAL